MTAALPYFSVYNPRPRITSTLNYNTQKEKNNPHVCATQLTAQPGSNIYKTVLPMHDPSMSYLQAVALFPTSLAMLIIFCYAVKDCLQAQRYSPTTNSAKMQNGSPKREGKWVTMKEGRGSFNMPVGGSPQETMKLLIAENVALRCGFTSAQRELL